jgi:hypothetical protein
LLVAISRQEIMAWDGRNGPDSFVAASRTSGRIRKLFQPTVAATPLRGKEEAA